VGNISKSGRHLLNLINEILDLSKVEAGKMEIYYEKFPVSDAFSEIVELVSQLASKKKLSLETEVEQVDVICADKAKFKQILYNLLSNAIKFTPPGGNIRVCATVRGQDLLVSVRDNGIGIAKEDQKKLFNAFTQVDSSSSRNYEGTGLGLSLAKKFVEMHNGRIRVESEPGVGSTFSFTIPLGLIPCAPENDYGLQEEAGQTRKEENVSGESS
jgi:signal transduction histidine kinase